MTGDSKDFAWQVEEVCLNLRPALFETFMRGWLIRTSGGSVRRINAACPTQYRSSRFEPILEASEDIYRTLGRPSIIKVLSIADNIDGLLEDRGYTTEGHSKVLLGDNPAAFPDASAVRVCEGVLDQEWFEAWTTIGKTQSVEARTVFESSMKAIVLPKAFAALKVNGEIASMAYGVLHQGVLGIDAVATRADSRGNGYAYRVISALQEWANGRGVRASCLSVEAGNRAGLALYRKCGLNQHVYDYHYRVKTFDLPTT